ncbi:hypothetical protein QT971_13700, partial [Microcoleus sp. herbarium19]
MAKLDGLQTVLDFLKGLQPKIAAQIAKKVLALNVDPLPNDSKQLTINFKITTSKFSKVRSAHPTINL